MADINSGHVTNPIPEPPPVVASEDASEDVSEHLAEMSASDSQDEDFDDFTDSGSDDMADHNRRLLNAQEYRRASASLQKELWMRRVENPRGQHTFYIPENEKRELITRDTIIRLIQLRHPKLSPEIVAEYADAVETTAMNLFATLASIGKGGDIVAFLNERISDGHMPFQRSEGFMFDLRGGNGEEIKSIRRWGHVEREAFDRQQWWMLAPFFSLGQHHDLRDNAVLPFVPSLQQQEEDRHQSTGAYSEVSTVRIHDKHHDFWGACVSNGRGLQVAVKKLKENDEREFEKERTVLNMLGKKQHDHLVKLLASYKYKGHYHLIFPRANSNLRTYWETHSQPPFDTATILWALRQMKGIASGLNTVHNFKVTIPLSVDGNLRMTKENHMLSVESGEELHGRHGDIKPENILWFERTLHSNDGRGALQIADFGLGRFHGRESRTESPGYHIFSSLTYEPPECHLNLRVSRAYDIWSLGCLYLEFITWLMLGSDGIEEFSKERSENSFILHQEGKIQDDYFWTLWFDGNMRRAKPRRGVGEWVKKLQEHKNCTMVVRDLLDLITTGLLRIEPKNRMTSMQMYGCLRQILRRAENDHQYICEPVPLLSIRPGSLPISVSPTIGTETKEKLQKKVEFDEPLISSSKEFRQNFARDVELHEMDTEEDRADHPATSAMSSNLVRDVQSSSAGSSTEGALKIFTDSGSKPSTSMTDAIDSFEDDVNQQGCFIDGLTEYSEETDRLNIESYSDEFATIIFRNLALKESERQLLDAILPILEAALKGFSSRLAYEANACETRADTVRIRKYRTHIKQSFKRIWSRSFPTDGGSNQEEGDERVTLHSHEKEMSVDEKVSMMWAKPDMRASDQSFEGDKDLVSEEDDRESNTSEPASSISEGNAHIEEETIVRSCAFTWLMSRLQRAMVLAVSGTDHMTSIRQAILQQLPSSRRISKEKPLELFGAVFSIDWDPKSFVKQNYHETMSVSEALATAITFTGSAEYTQALTCREYLNQTWPSSGLSILRLLQTVFKSAEGVKQALKAPDGTLLEAWYTRDQVNIRLEGVPDAIAEIGEQLAWLGSALRSSTVKSDIAFYAPRICNIQNLELPENSALRMEVKYDVKFSTPTKPVDYNKRPGMCWRGLFRNPVIVEGYPTLRRTSSAEFGSPEVGLEIPLNIMAALAQSRRITDFDGRLYVKGFSRMTVATKYTQREKLLLWHLFYNKDGTHLSYVDTCLEEIETLKSSEISFAEIDDARHILGWCTKVQNLTGTEDANYDIRRSGRKEPHAGCRLERFNISGGKYVNFGVSFSIGVKDEPTNFKQSRCYFEIIQQLHTSFVVFYDVSDRRAWLVNGASALLHLVRASLKYDEKSVIGEKLLFKPKQLKVGEAKYATSSAAEILQKRANMELPVLPHKREVFEELTSSDQSEPPGGSTKIKQTYLLFQDRVEQVHHMLEQAIAYQMKREATPGMEVKLKPRNYLEGFDFSEIAARKPHVVLRVHELQPTGRCWIDFTRALHAVTLFGSGFGELIRPLAQAETCRKWSSVPPGYDHLAVGVADLQYIIKENGELGPTPTCIVDGIHWHNPDKLFGDCDCTAKGATTACDRAQVLLPSRLNIRRWTNRTQHPGPWEEEKDGAIIFGHSRKMPIHWPDDPGHDPNEMASQSQSYDVSSTSRQMISTEATSELQPHSVTSSNESSHLMQSTQETVESTAPTTETPPSLSASRDNDQSNTPIPSSSNEQGEESSNRTGLLKNLRVKLFKRLGLTGGKK